MDNGLLCLFRSVDVCPLKSLALRLRDRFPGAELAFDAWRPFEIWIDNRVLGWLLRWGFWRSQELESWGSIRLLDERFPFQFPEMDKRRALRVRLFLPLVAKGIGVILYQLRGSKRCPI